jgi:hypothetical protein
MVTCLAIVTFLKFQAIKFLIKLHRRNRIIIKQSHSKHFQHTYTHDTIIGLDLMAAIVPQLCICIQNKVELGQNRINPSLLVKIVSYNNLVKIDLHSKQSHSIHFEAHNNQAITSQTITFQAMTF